MTAARPDTPSRHGPGTARKAPPSPRAVVVVRHVRGLTFGRGRTRLGAATLIRSAARLGWAATFTLMARAFGTTAAALGTATPTPTVVAPRPAPAATTTAGAVVAITRAAVAVAVTAMLVLRSEEHTSELQSQSNLVCR